MAIGPISQIMNAHMVLSTPTVQKDTTVGGVSAYEREQEERLQIEFLARQMGVIRESLAAIRENWAIKDLFGESAPATVVAGQRTDFDVLLQNLPGFGAVTAGSILVNGVSIAVDPAADTMTDISERISASSAGVTAGPNGSDERLRLQADDPEAVLTLDDNGVGLLAALGMVEGTHEPTFGEVDEGMTSARSDTIADELRNIYQAINAIFEGPDDTGEAGSWLVRARSRLQGALERAVKDDDRALADDFGLDVDYEGLEDVEGGFLPDSRRLELGVANLLRGRAGRVEEFLFGDKSSRKGLMGLLETNHESVMENLESIAGNRGVSIDRYV